LETKLEAAGFATFRDKREISAGEILDSTLKRAIQRTRHFVLLDTPAARRSPWVTGEIKSFLQSKAGKLTRINLGGVSEKATWPGLEGQELSRRLEDFVWTSDTPEAFASGKPSDGVIEEITSGFRRVRLRNLMRLTVANRHHDSFRFTDLVGSEDDRGTARSTDCHCT
jgi:TIR domain